MFSDLVAKMNRKMKILNASQIKELDTYTIVNEPIASLDLMERASLVFVNWFVNKFPNQDIPIYIFCGPGNNGGDGLAVARLLQQRFYNIAVYACQIGSDASKDFQKNWERLPRKTEMKIFSIWQDDYLEDLPEGGIVIDAIFGSGLNRPIEGYWASLITHLNEQPVTRVAIDVPSGLSADSHTESVCIQAHDTFTFEMPKLAFLFPENQHYVGNWDFASIGLHPDFIAKTETIYHYLDEAAVRPFLHRRQKYDHKGTYGHALLITGSYGKIGAAILSARACLRSGVGLLTIHAPKCAYPILQISIPEAMVSVDRHEFYFSETPKLEKYQAIGIGCGLDTKKTSAEAVEILLEESKVPLVIDADGLNLIAKNKNLLSKIPKNSILTPHPKEFERLFGEASDDFARNKLQRLMAQELGVYIILKGAHTCIATPEGACYFNSTGNPGMATGGTGDVLTGIITGLIAQGYASLEAAILGVYLHGLSGDLAAENIGKEALIAGDLIQYLGKAFKLVEKVIG